MMWDRVGAVILHILLHTTWWRWVILTLWTAVVVFLTLFADSVRGWIICFSKSQLLVREARRETDRFRRALFARREATDRKVAVYREAAIQTVAQALLEKGKSDGQ